MYVHAHDACVRVCMQVGKSSKMNELVSDMQCSFEIDPKMIKLKQKINEGNFGTVWLAVVVNGHARPQQRQLPRQCVSV
jgi:hypothetical protein